MSCDMLNALLWTAVSVVLSPFVNRRRFMYLVISLLVYRAGCGIWLYQFLIIASFYFFSSKQEPKKQIQALGYHFSDIFLINTIAVIEALHTPYTGIILISKAVWNTDGNEFVSAAQGSVECRLCSVCFSSNASDLHFKIWRKFLTGLAAKRNCGFVGSKCGTNSISPGRKFPSFNLNPFSKSL